MDRIFLTCQCLRHSCKKLRLCVYKRLLPRRQVMFHRSMTNSSFTRMAPITAGYRRSLCLLQISDARVFRNTSDSLSITPEVEKTRGVKTPRSMLTTRWQYWRFFSCSFLTSCAWISDKVNSSDLGWVTRMSKKKLPVVLSRIRGPWCPDGLRWIGLLTCTSATNSQKAGGLAPPQRRNK